MHVWVMYMAASQCLTAIWFQTSIHSGIAAAALRALRAFRLADGPRAGGFGFSSSGPTPLQRKLIFRAFFGCTAIRGSTAPALCKALKRSRARATAGLSCLKLPVTSSVVSTCTLTIRIFKTHLLPAKGGLPQADPWNGCLGLDSDTPGFRGIGCRTSTFFACAFSIGTARKMRVEGPVNSSWSCLKLCLTFNFRALVTVVCFVCQILGCNTTAHIFFRLAFPSPEMAVKHRQGPCTTLGYDCANLLQTRHT